jgi:hypothetical protein
VKVSIAPETVLQSAAVMSDLRSSLPSGRLPAVEGSGDHAVDRALADFESWWVAISAGTSEDIAALHHRVTATATVQVTRDRQAAADIEINGDPMAAFRMK